MFILFFLVWIIFNGRFTLEVAIFGLIISALMFWFICKFMNYSFKKELALAKKLWLFLRLAGVLIIEIAKANEHVIAWVYKSQRAEPCLVKFKVDLKDEALRVLLANCITLTPGTITGSLEGNEYRVHCLDKSMAEGLDQSAFVQVLSEMEAK